MSKESESKSSQYPSEKKSFRLPSLPKFPGIPRIKDILRIKGDPIFKDVPGNKRINPKSIIERLITLIQVGKSGGAGDPLHMGDSGKSGGLSRPMKYPYTLGAKIGQFPYKFMWNSVWPFKYYLIGVVLSIPIFYKIGKLSYQPNNVRNWEKIRRELYTPGHH